MTAGCGITVGGGAGGLSSGNGTTSFSLEVQATRKASITKRQREVRIRRIV